MELRLEQVAACGVLESVTMADEIVWLRCKKCMAPLRFVAYSGGWGCYYDGADIKKFIDEHIQTCYAPVEFDHLDDETFFELVTFKDIEAVIKKQPVEKSAEEKPSGEETTG